MGKKFFLILECLCKNIEMWFTRQRPNAAKFVNSWFYTQNHPTIAKISVFGQKIIIIDPFYTALTPKTLFWHLLYGYRDLKSSKSNFQIFLKINFFGVLAVFKSFLVIVPPSTLWDIFEFQTLLKNADWDISVFFNPLPPLLGHCPKFSRFSILMPPLISWCL